MVLAMNNMKLPVGIDQFDKLIKSGFYYVDKTRLIEQLLQNWGEVNLFTRPRRFGKTLNMSMLKSFFEIGTDKTLFDQLYKIQITAAKTSKYQKAVKYVTVKVK
ncbi:hypothetical protein Ahadr17467_21100 [Anaerostipes hadrus ATCC 29173 = JCM 17467]|nr:hypothetical protein Ahadr17467_21100 [Anaerostipes hadrus ATCC 29173 = JCM 17467]